MKMEQSVLKCRQIKNKRRGGITPPPKKKINKYSMYLLPCSVNVLTIYLFIFYIYFGLHTMSRYCIFSVCYHDVGDRGSTVVKVLYYKWERCWFDSRWCHRNFSLT